MPSRGGREKGDDYEEGGQVIISVIMLACLLLFPNMIDLIYDIFP
jgi:hypothetical protein